MIHNLSLYTWLKSNSNAFDCWLNKYKHIIKDDEDVKGNIDLLVQHICVLRASTNQKLGKFLNNGSKKQFFYDNFHIVWNKIKSELNIEHSVIKSQLTHLDEMSEIEENQDAELELENEDEKKETDWLKL